MTKVNWDEIRNEWETTKKTYKQLEEQFGVNGSTIRSRKNREKWSRSVATKSATKSKAVATKKEEYELVVESDKLTDKQRLFCIYYIKSFNATMAAIKAGYAPDSAHVQGSRLLRNDKVAEEIRKLKGEMQQGIFIDAMDVLNKYIQIAFADITDFVEFGAEEREERDEDGDVIYDMAGNPVTYLASYVRFKEHDEVDGTILTEVKQGKDGISVKLADKMKAMEFLSKHFDMVPDHFKRRLEEEKLKLAHAKVFGTDDPEEYEDDGFNEALDATTSEVWDDANDSEAEEGS